MGSAHCTCGKTKWDRICEDCKLTVNQVSKLNNYPVPKTEDLLAALGGGEKFTKLDMSQAYQQMTLDEESRKFTTIYTHKGLFQYNRLPFGSILECLLRLVFFKGGWKTSCKAFHRSLCEQTTFLLAGMTTTVTLPIYNQYSRSCQKLGCSCEKKNVSSWCRKSPIVVMRSVVVVSSQ